MSYLVYILECADKTLYVGSTNDLTKRLHAHNNLKSGAHYTKIRRPVILRYQEKFSTYNEARKREAEIKSLKREEKLSFIKNNKKTMPKTKKYEKLADQKVITKTIEALKKKGLLAETVATKAEALARIKELIPKGASVMNGSSRTLEEIGFVDFLKAGKHGWNNLHEAVLKEKDPVKQAKLRKESVLSDFYLGSAHAVAQTGEIVIASNSGSQLPHLVFTSPNLILVVGTQKIASNLEKAITRLEDYVFPLEDARAKGLGWGGSFISKLLIINREFAQMGRKFHIILVSEKLGY
ncbi:MAG: LUD domain-containing protein [Patescibacteria group bacterium]